MTDPLASDGAALFRATFREEPTRLVMLLEGEIDSSSSAEFEDQLDAVKLRDGQDLLLDMSGLERIDSTGVAVVLDVRKNLAGEGHSLQVRGARDNVRKIFEISLKHASVLDAETPGAFWDPVSQAGQAALFLKYRLTDFAIQFGDSAYWLLVAPWHGKSIRWRETIRQAGLMGADAIAIVALISLLMGLIMAMQAAHQLRQFGASIFVADMVGIATTRELGPLMTAILVAGRSGSSIAAELGTMVVSEEIDALRTMGLNPVRYLVVPRILALVIVMPCLVVFADAVSIFGGFLVGTINLGLAPHTYINQTIQALYLADIFSGLIKAMVFGAVIANIGVFEGMHVWGGSEAVGRATTRAVVQSILFVIVADAIFTALFYLL
jgi:phospholipid/cholesterol/gamma-HCH transport system permease protein